MPQCVSAIFEFNERLALRALSAALACALFFAISNRAEAQGLALNQRVLVVYNSADANSIAVANHYVAQRAIPSANLCPITPPSTSLLAWADYTPSVRTPVQNCLTALGSNNILYIVFTYNTPYSLIGPDGATYSLDQFVADIWDVYEPAGQYGLPTSTHAYYAQNQSEGNVYTPFVSLATFRSQNSALIYSVWRLDAATPALAQGLVDKAMTAEAAGLSGQVCIDETTNPPGYDYGLGGPEWELRRAANFAREVGFSVTEDQNNAEFGTAPAPLRCDNAALYSGWYSFNNYNNAFTWNTGAIGYHIDSASAVNPRGGSNWSANALLNGITATHGSVAEPYVTAFAHPDGVLNNLFQGANLGDAFLRNTAYLKWMMLNIGDPLYRPFPAGFPVITAPVNSLALNPQYLIGGGPSTGTITLAAPSASDTMFTLTSNQTAAATVPPTVTVPAGQTTASFPISTSFVTSDTPLLINATAPGLTLTNTLVPVAVLADLLLNTGAVTAGSSATGTIYLNENAPQGGIVVGLATNNGAATVPASVTVPAGTSTVSFPITTSAVTSNTSVSVGASYAGALVTATLTVNVAPPVISAVTAVSITTSGATITWTTDKASDSQAAYGLTATYGALSALNSTLVTSHSVNLTGLAPSTTYHYQVRSHDSQGRLTSSGDFALTTAGGLAGYWNFDEGSGTVAHDTSGNGYDGTVNGAAWITGKINGALSLNGGAAYVVTPNIALGSAFSASAWVNPAAAPQAAFARILETQYNGGLYLGANSTGTKYKFIVNTGNGTKGGCGAIYGCAEGGIITAGWHLVTGTFDGTTAALYVDGAAVASDTFTAPSVTNFALYVGRYYGGGDGWNGGVDDVRLYSRALAATEVSALYNSANSTDTTPPSTPSSVTATPVSGSQINVDWSASTDNVGVAGYKVFRNGSLAGSTTTALTYSDRGLAASTSYSYTVEAYDAAGNVSAPSTPVTATTLTPNTTPPSVSITAPAANATVSGTTTVSANATDNVAVASVQFQLDGANLGALLTAAPYTISWNTATASNNNHTLTAIATDTSGNTATSTPVTVTVSNTSTGPPTQGLIGYWNFDEGSGTVAHDTSGSGYNGTVNGAAWTTGEINGALSFNGGTAYVVTPNIALASTFSVSAWVNPTVTKQTGYARILETQYNIGLELGVNSSGTKYKFIVNSGAGSTGGCGLAFGCAEGGTITAGWHLVTGTYDGTTATLYVDGTAVASDTSTAPSSTNLPLYVGRYYAGGYGWSGSVDDVRLYNRALSATEVSTIYSSAGSSDTTPPSTPGSVTATPVSSSQINVGWLASTDNVGVAGYKVFRNGSLAGSTTTALTYSDTGLAASTSYSYTVEAYDAAGNVSTPSTPVNAATLTPDTTPPSVSITAPTANTTVSGPTTVSANATDNVAVASVQFQLDGANLGALLTSAPYTISWNTATASNNNHTLTAIATDTSGNTATSTPVTVTVSNTSTGPPTQGLIGYWNFDEGSGTVAHDTSGSGYNGTVNGAAWTTGEINGALSFNGGTAYVVTPNIALASAFSVSAWVNPALTKQIGYARILETQYNVGLYLGVNSSGTKYKFIVNMGAGSTGGCGLTYGCAEGGTITAGWHLVTATYDGTTATLYVDGTVVATDTFTAPSARNLPLYVGRYYGGGYGWNGSVDDVRLYNRALTAAEVASLESFQ